jgi:hypothetical protein
MYFIESGQVNVCKQLSGDAPVTTLTAGAFFGEMALLTANSRALATIVTATYMEGFFLSREVYLTIVDTYPQFQRYIETVAVLRLKKGQQTSPGKAEPENDSTDGLRGSRRGRSRSRVLLESLEAHSPPKYATRQDKTASRLVKRLSTLPDMDPPPREEEGSDAKAVSVAKGSYASRIARGVGLRQSSAARRTSDGGRSPRIHTQVTPFSPSRDSPRD